MPITKVNQNRSLAALNAIKPEENLALQKAILEKQRISEHQELEALKALKLKRKRSKKTEQASPSEAGQTKNQEFSD